MASTEDKTDNHRYIRVNFNNSIKYESLVITLYNFIQNFEKVNIAQSMFRLATNCLGKKKKTESIIDFFFFSFKRVQFNNFFFALTSKSLFIHESVVVIDFLRYSTHAYHRRLHPKCVSSRSAELFGNETQLFHPFIIFYTNPLYPALVW